MPASPEQFELDLKRPEKKDEHPEVKIYERDECQACGNMFESYGSCRQCANNKIKSKWLKENPRQKRAR